MNNVSLNNWKYYSIIEKLYYVTIFNDNEFHVISRKVKGNVANKLGTIIQCTFSTFPVVVVVAFVPIKIFHVYIENCNVIVLFINVILLDTCMEIIIIVNDP